MVVNVSLEENTKKNVRYLLLPSPKSCGVDGAALWGIETWSSCTQCNVKAGRPLPLTCEQKWSSECSSGLPMVPQWWRGLILRIPAFEPPDWLASHIDHGFFSVLGEHYTYPREHSGDSWVKSRFKIDWNWSLALFLVLFKTIRGSSDQGVDLCIRIAYPITFWTWLTWCGLTGTCVPELCLALQVISLGW